MSADPQTPAELAPAAARVLLVDDDVELCELLCEYLRVEGFSVRAVHDGEAAVSAVHEARDDLLVMDITMPRLDGFEALRRIRRFSPVPVLLLTARGEEVDRVVGLELGADDYLPKPFSPRELAARVRAILRRARLPGQSAATPPTLRVGDLVLDPGARTLSRRGTPVPLTGAEFDILARLLAEPGIVIAKETLSREVLGRRLTPFDRSLDTHVSNLRRKLGPRADGSPRIMARRGHGYLYVRPPVDEAPA